ncbi:MAG: hypothetical protein ACM357_06255, partial [Gemmatimonadota bacterium]
RLRRVGGPQGRLLGAILDAMYSDPELRAERDRAADRSRTHTDLRVQDPERVTSGRARGLP